MTGRLLSPDARAGLSEHDRDEVEALEDFLALAGPAPTHSGDPRALAEEDERLSTVPGLTEWANGTGPAPRKLDRAYGAVWRCDGMGV